MHNQVVLDCKDRVGLEVRVIVRVELGDKSVVLWMCDLGGHVLSTRKKKLFLKNNQIQCTPYHQVNMRRPHRRPIHQLQQLPRRPIPRQRIRRGPQAIKPIVAIGIRAELAPQVVGDLVLRVLEIVLAVGRRLPDIDDGVGDGFLGLGIGHGAVHERHLALMRAEDDRIAVLAEGSIGVPEWTQDCARGRGVVGRDG